MKQKQIRKFKILKKNRKQISNLLMNLIKYTKKYNTQKQINKIRLKYLDIFSNKKNKQKTLLKIVNIFQVKNRKIFLNNLKTF